MIKRILIIGGNGFLGFNLAKKLNKYNYEIVLLCKKENKFKILKNIDYIYCNICNFKQLKKKLTGEFDYVVNFSGNKNHKHKQETYSTHFHGLKNIIKILKKKNVKIFLQSGSCFEYGNYKSPQKEKSICFPISNYGKVKYMASKFLINSKPNFKYIILRLYQVYGPYQKNDRLLPITINACLKNKKFKCTEGLQKRDFLYVDDLNDLLMKIFKKKKIKSGIYNVGYGKQISVKKVIKNIQTIVKKGKPIFGAIKIRDDETMNLYPKILKVKRYFNWKPKTSLSKGLKETVKFYEKYK